MSRGKTYSVVIESGEDDWYVARCPAIPGCISQGKTVDEALPNIKEAIEVCSECYEEDGVSPPEDCPVEVRVEKVAV